MLSVSNNKAELSLIVPLFYMSEPCAIERGALEPGAHKPGALHTR